MDGITISASELREKAGSIRSKVGGMKESLGIATNAMNTTSGSFEGSGAEAIRSEYMNLEKRFSAFCEKAESYAAFLEKTANAYEQAEAQIQKSV